MTVELVCQRAISNYAVAVKQQHAHKRQLPRRARVNGRLMLERVGSHLLRSPILLAQQGQLLIQLSIKLVSAQRQPCLLLSLRYRHQQPPISCRPLTRVNQTRTTLQMFKRRLLPSLALILATRSRSRQQKPDQQMCRAHSPRRVATPVVISAHLPTVCGRLFQNRQLQEA